MLPILEMLCIFYWLHDGEIKGTAVGLLVTDFTDTSLLWELSWEHFQTGDEDLLKNDSKNSTFHPQIFCVFYFHQTFLIWAFKDEGVVSAPLAGIFKKAK